MLKLRTDQTRDYPTSTNQQSNTNLETTDPSTSAQTIKTTSLRSQTPGHSESIKPSLWDRAYDDLKKTDGQLVEEYEKLLSIELRTNTGQKLALPIDHDDNFYETMTTTENRINSTNPNKRLEQLKTITDRGLGQLEDGRTKYRIFGHDFIPHNKLAQATRFIQNIRNIIDEAVRLSPHASLAWAGVCVLLPLFMNSSIAEEASRDGYLYVTSRIQFYLKLEPLLLSSCDKFQTFEINKELENRLIALYQQVIEFQMKTVRRVYLTRLVRYTEDTTGHEDWKDMKAKIQQSEEILINDSKLVNDVVTRGELKKLSENAKGFFADITSILTPLVKDSCKGPTLHFRNEGSGTQYNTTGGVQHNGTVNGNNFSGATFGGPLKFNQGEACR
ncbi:uncharacterized protein Triagg1_6953 [Trichoderma aggressivum f. europaeum]|uniref:NWD NACHT-NTPase N-terminal domain-containing protein n=1 Tax=Trichoderma aggressivum f. europaeum TaxID=173218 RepID=A0AAE1LYZ9_9HYPO|nr:hypothetical protein Triagg1_6953 [Trichoderma aggressivum f. europaeum]